MNPVEEEIMVEEEVITKTIEVDQEVIAEVHTSQT